MPHRTKPGDFETCNLGEFNGLDYMLLYNLYRISYLRNTPNELVIPIDYPYYHNFADHMNRYAGSHDTPIVFDAKNSIESAKVVESDGDVKFRANSL